MSYPALSKASSPPQGYSPTVKTKQNNNNNNKVERAIIISGEIKGLRVLAALPGPGFSSPHPCHLEVGLTTF